MNWPLVRRSRLAAAETALADTTADRDRLAGRVRAVQLRLSWLRRMSEEIDAQAHQLLDERLCLNAKLGGSEADNARLRRMLAEPVEVEVLIHDRQVHSVHRDGTTAKRAAFEADPGAHPDTWKRAEADIRGEGWHLSHRTLPGLRPTEIPGAAE
ncbi:hypothetical protein [Streptomyces albireticuli]|uniref:Uncharacterized protein n=1 Tax=Streptomyces albireticuli TaxID=1940 RepID=A0A2A2CYI9_9ACTN|nr:hypothetical protein [Streptomyces albireticuli]MCD9145891.1 hypothetical protein [Streptomyces albireticuli]MCD9166105.1 hypothetical protein [Streptomyces albireticuli]MCD9196385.1 hypothetical protein [Streptomyces albireticuli]PAU45288.1 hypothetical protein CK936_30205 [Streptomyces albireticuli]